MAGKSNEFGNTFEPAKRQRNSDEKGKDTHSGAAVEDFE